MYETQEGPRKLARHYAYGRYAGAICSEVSWGCLYCSHLGKRLPHAYEWQLSAQGPRPGRYPWGEEEDPSRMPATPPSGSTSAAAATAKV